MKIKIKPRPFCQQSYSKARSEGLPELFARLIANRVQSEDDQTQVAFAKIVTPKLADLTAPAELKDAETAAQRIAQAVIKQETIGIITDYDVDGITSHAIIYRALTEFFDVASDRIQSLIGHRMRDGYGVSQGLTTRILQQQQLPDIIITADCGSSDQARIEQLQAAGIEVIVTDHHAIPAEGIPKSAYAVVNPTREDCGYPDALIAGCMVAWLLMCQVRTALCALDQRDIAKLSTLLDYVALGTVADAVSLFSLSNRAVVRRGLALMNQLGRPCWRAMRYLLNQGRQGGVAAMFSAEDLGFQLGPRINARSRMADPYAALKYLLANNDDEAMQQLMLLNEDNEQRKTTERQMVDIANVAALNYLSSGCLSISVSDDSFHAGVQGIVAARLVDRLGHPAVVFSPTQDEQVLTGSARTIDEVHIRQVLQFVADAGPEIIVGFGGHKGAAGLKIKKAKLAAFNQLFDQGVREQLKALGLQQLRPIRWSDGVLPAEMIGLETFDTIAELQPFGREFEAPAFEGDFRVVAVNVIGKDKTHLRLELEAEGRHFTALWFKALEKAGDPIPVQMADTVHCLYRLADNHFRGTRQLQLMIEVCELKTDVNTTPQIQSAEALSVL